jgi:hypothetical protein
MMQMIEEDKRTHRVKCDYGTADYYKDFIREYKLDHIDSATFGAIVKEFNSHVRDGISKKGSVYTIPCRLGKIELRKIKTEVTIGDDGKIINNLPPNWRETRKLWAQSEVARRNRTKIRYTNEHTDGYTFRITYFKTKANFKNKSIYRLQFNREMKRELSKSIFKGNIDAFLKQ